MVYLEYFTLIGQIVVTSTPLVLGESTDNVGRYCRSEWLGCTCRLQSCSTEGEFADARTVPARAIRR
jgi:hypothetical protein